LKMVKTPRIIQADKNNVFFDTDGNPNSLAFDELPYDTSDRIYYTENPEDDAVSNISIHKSELSSKQHETEKRVRNTSDKTWIFVDGVLDSEGVFMNSGLLKTT